MKQMNLVPITSKVKRECDEQRFYFKDNSEGKPIFTVCVYSGKSKRLITTKVRAKVLREWYGELEKSQEDLLEEMIIILQHHQVDCLYQMEDWLCFAMKKKEKNEGQICLCFSKEGSFFIWEVQQVIRSVSYIGIVVEGPIYVRLTNGSNAILLPYSKYYEKVQDFRKLGKCGYLLKVNNENMLLNVYGHPISNTMTINKKKESIEIIKAKCMYDIFLLVTTNQGMYVLPGSSFDESIPVDTVPQKKSLDILFWDKLYVAEQKGKKIYFLLLPRYLKPRVYHGKVASDYKIINQSMMCLKLKNKWYPVVVSTQIESLIIEEAYQYDYFLLTHYQEVMHDYLVKERYPIQIIKEEGYVEEIIEMIRCSVSKKYSFDLIVNTIKTEHQKGKKMFTYQEFILSDVTSKTLTDRVAPCLQNKEASIISIKYKKNCYYFMLIEK